MTITKTTRAAIRTILANSREYDASTMRISRSGEVSARKDADKTFSGNDDRRYLVGHVADMVNASGNIREGY